MLSEQRCSAQWAEVSESRFHKALASRSDRLSKVRNRKLAEGQERSCAATHQTAIRAVLYYERRAEGAEFITERHRMLQDTWARKARSLSPTQEWMCIESDLACAACWQKAIPAALHCALGAEGAHLLMQDSHEFPLRSQASAKEQKRRICLVQAVCME